MLLQYYWNKTLNFDANTVSQSAVVVEDTLYASSADFEGNGNIIEPCLPQSWDVLTPTKCMYCIYMHKVSYNI